MKTELNQLAQSMKESVRLIENFLKETEFKMYAKHLAAQIYFESISSQEVNTPFFYTDINELEVIQTHPFVRANQKVKDAILSFSNMFDQATPVLFSMEENTIYCLKTHEHHRELLEKKLETVLEKLSDPELLEEFNIYNFLTKSVESMNNQHFTEEDCEEEIDNDCKIFIINEVDGETTIEKLESDNIPSIIKDIIGEHIQNIDKEKEKEDKKEIKLTRQEMDNLINVCQNLELGLDKIESMLLGKSINIQQDTIVLSICELPLAKYMSEHAPTVYSLLEDKVEELFVTCFKTVDLKNNHKHFFVLETNQPISEYILENYKIEALEEAKKQKLYDRFCK